MRYVIKAADELVKADTASPGRFSGYGSTFGNVDSDFDIIAPGAFSRSLADLKAKGRAPKMFFAHDPRRPIGDYLAAREDDHGLWVDGQLWVDGDHPNADALTAQRMMKSPGGAGLSIGFRIRDEELDRELGVRRIKDLDLKEISVVSFGANDQAVTTMIKAAQRVTSIREFEAWLRDEGGFTREQAKALAAVGYAKAMGTARDERPDDGDDRRDAANASMLENLAAALRSFPAI